MAYLAGYMAAAHLVFLNALDEDFKKTKEGPLAIEIADGLAIHDVARKKELSCKAYFPKMGGPYPLILFSHGFGANKDAFGPISKHWASHGYVVIHPSHSDWNLRGSIQNRNNGGLEKAAPRPPAGLVGALSDPEKIKGRVADLVLILDNLDEVAKSAPGLQGKIDPNRIGVGGHSFGAYTAMLIAGVTVDLGKTKALSLRDPRVQCILPISGQGTGQQGLTNNSWNALQIPMMTITGSRDRGAGGQGVEWKKEPYKLSPPGDKYLVVIDGANHLSFGGGLGARSGNVTDSVKLCSAHFWDAYLKKSAVSKKYLQSEKPGKEAGHDFFLEKK
ncbi:MAG: alpha/beta hydrolase family protein [Gemmataceae bacterium]